LTELFTQEFIDDHIKLLEKHNAVKIMPDIDYGSEFYTLDHISDDLYKFNQSSLHLNSCQPSIWKTSYLKQVLKPDYSPWDFEIRGNNFTNTLNPFPTLLLKVRPDHMYFNFVRIGGRISEGWEQLYIKENLQ
jgi:hypothetical protein